MKANRNGQLKANKSSNVVVALERSVRKCFCIQKTMRIIHVRLCNTFCTKRGERSS